MYSVYGMCGTLPEKCIEGMKNAQSGPEGFCLKLPLKVKKRYIIIRIQRVAQLRKSGCAMGCIFYY